MDSSSENSRASWRDPELDKYFLEQCIEEVTRAGRLGTSLRPESWTRVRDVIKEKFNIPFNQRQLKNRYDYLKDKYQEWVALKNKTGNLYNPTTNSFNMSRDEWDEYIKTHPKAKTLKTSNLPFPDLCSSLFDGAAATGMKGWGPASEKPRPNSGHSTSAVSLELCHIEDDFNDNEDHTQENQELPRKNGPRSNATQSSSAEKSSKKKKQNQFDLDEKMGKAYTHTKSFMAPYRGVKYWLGDFRRRRAIMKEEKFNHAHAQLRNVIERAYGVLKARFAILKRMAPFDLDTQRDIVIACFAIHNYLRMQNISDELFNQFEQPDIIIDEDEEAEQERDNGAQGPYWNTEDQQFMNNLRDEIANTLSNNLH